MKNRILLWLTGILLAAPLWLSAQRVLYSPVVGSPAVNRFEVVGRAGDFYWIQRSTRKGVSKPVEPWLDDKDLRYEIYDARMNLVNTVAHHLPASVIKEYLVAGSHGFDQLAFAAAGPSTLAIRYHFTPEGASAGEDTLAAFPGSMQGNDFLLVRSQDNSRILLLGFERRPGERPRLHATLYGSNWNVICRSLYTNPNITQPFIQYDLVGYPLDDFSNSPIKLANTGEWMMVSPSQSSANYHLFHFNGVDSAFVYRELKDTRITSVQDVALSVDNTRGEAYAGILLNTRYPSLKKARVAHYLLARHAFDFDTTYRFSTASAIQKNNENIYEQYFMTVPGKGFVFLKEYGRPFAHMYADAAIRNDEDNTDEQDALQFTGEAPAPINKNDYTRFGTLAGTRSKFDRGDLSLYYFPAAAGDSCWSGFINKEQTNELNSSYLSYVFMPVGDKLIFLYNSLFNNYSKFSSTTILNPQGNLLNEGLVFWQGNNILDFQRARQISAAELAIPYERNLRNGFAIIRLQAN